MTLPALLPPTIANKIAIFDKLARCAMANAMGATVITATSTKTPTAVSIIVAIASANKARVSPTFLIMVSAIDVAVPDSISTPAKTPAARIRNRAVKCPQKKEGDYKGS
jgi:hypothetical protein